MIDIAGMLEQYGFSEDEAKDTEHRWQNWFIERLQKDVYIDRYFKAISEIDVDQMVIVDNLDVEMMCPHHLLPVTLRVHIAYLPDGKVLGLSKFGRVAQGLAASQLQEGYTQRLVEIIGKNLVPKWAMVVVVGTHTCMTCRGVLARRSETITSAIWNVDFDEDGVLKGEFMDFIGHPMRK